MLYSRGYFVLVFSYLYLLYLLLYHSFSISFLCHLLEQVEGVQFFFLLLAPSKSQGGFTMHDLTIDQTSLGIV
ncbi:hypothetical protein VNO77_01840 [Canavalia gladiata]|uniref:Uncharacterized protein n=1 Tax=Canavalia gladiata TaxID=3824 RepID=A0AAN9MRW6_CANGL